MHKKSSSNGASLRGFSLNSPCAEGAIKEIASAGLATGIGPTGAVRSHGCLNIHVGFSYEPAIQLAMLKYCC
ncbi:protein of unknown function (plasmid) [Caballeronia sp. S22]